MSPIRPAAAFLAVALATCLTAQDAAPPTRAFDTVNVRVSEGCGLYASNGAIYPAVGAVALGGVTMLQVIRAAYNQPVDLIVGGPSWLDVDRYDIYARTTPQTPIADLRAMLQALLADRFGLVVRRDETPMPAYVLVPGDGKPLMKPSEDPGPPLCSSSQATPGSATLTCRHMTMAAFVTRLPSGGYLNDSPLPVSDATGLADAYDFTFTFRNLGQLARPSTPGYDPSIDITLFDAIEKQLGLKLDRRIQPTPVLVVDRVNRVPGPNPAGIASNLPAVPTEFDVADVRPSQPSAAPQPNRTLPGGEVEWHNQSLQALIKLAFGIDYDVDIVNAPAWLNSDKFDINAKTGVPMNELAADAAAHGCVHGSPMAAMLRNLLAHRFQLAVHDEVQPVQVYALQLDGRAARLQPADPAARSDCAYGVAPGARVWTCTNTTMAQLATRIDRDTDYAHQHTVVDATGLEGAFNFTLTFTPIAKVDRDRNVGPFPNEPNRAPAEPDTDLDLFQALRKELGLRLQSTKRPMPVLAIDHVERTPTPN